MPTRGGRLMPRKVTSREGRVSRNAYLVMVVGLLPVTSREGRVSRNLVLAVLSGGRAESRPARGV